jgi:AraC-like DNA-binding protein
MQLFSEQIIMNDKLFILKEERFPYNDFPLHIHPEYELILVMKSSGKRYVGDNIAPFYPGDLCLFGPNLPHTFYNKHLPGDREVHQIVIQFREDVLGKDLLQKPQLSHIRELFQRAQKGITFKEEAAADKMKQMVNADETEALAGLLSLLNLLAKSANYELLSGEPPLTANIEKETARMNRVYHFLLDNFKKEITLAEAAAVAHLSAEAFCRYFRKHTRKTLSAFVNDLRISYACKMLQQQPEISISQVCYESGFNNVSYFNRQFKTITGLSPLKYQRKLSA